ncbi:MAG: ATP-binding protein [Phycisphaerales bacterium]
MPGPADHHPDAGQRSKRDQRASELAELGAMAPLYAHEINNLITQLSGRAQLAMMQPDNPELVAQVLNTIVEGCDRAARLSELFLVPCSSVSEPAEHATFRAVFDRVRAGIEPTNAAQIPIDLHEDQSAPDPAVPPSGLEQVLDNLIRNALRAIDEHSGTDQAGHAITIRTANAPHCSTWNTRGEPMLRICVGDTGIGMTSTQADALFTPSSQHRSVGPRNPRYPRHGLGMRVCKVLIESVGGSISCASVPNNGTRMTLLVPARDADAEQIRPAA